MSCWRSYPQWEPRPEMTNFTMASSQHLTGTEAHLIYHPTVLEGAKRTSIHGWPSGHLRHMIQPTIGRGIILVAVVKLQYEDTVSELLKSSTSNKVLLKVLSCWLSFHRLIATRKLQQGGRILKVMC